MYCIFSSQHYKKIKYENFSTTTRPIVNLVKCKYIYLPLVDAFNNAITLVKKVGDFVVGGEVIACNEAQEINVYAPFSGRIKSICSRYSFASSRNVDHLEIVNDFLSREIIPFSPLNISSSTKDELLKRIKEAGIVGLGGGGYPTYKKLSSLNIKNIIINLVECEAYLSSDYKATLSSCELLAQGIKIMCKITGAKKAFIAIKKDKKQLISLLECLVAKDDIVIAKVKNTYPSGWEKSLVKTILKKDYEKYPFEIGAIVINVQTVITVARAVCQGKVLTQRIVTVSGNNILYPQNVKCYIGTPIEELLKISGGLKKDDGRIFLGGTMMGKELSTSSTPTFPLLNAVIAMKKVIVNEDECLGCGRCSRVCPADLQPIFIKDAYEKRDLQSLKLLDAKSCILCGLCSYICPSKIELTEVAKSAKTIALAFERKKTK